MKTHLKHCIQALLLASPLALSSQAGAAVIVLDFEGVGNSASINNFYNGGTDSLGNSGTNYGIAFGGNSLGLVDSDAGGGGNIANEPSPSTVMFFLTGSAVLNYAPGFDTGFSFYYSGAATTAVNVYDGLDATGTLLASLNLAPNYNANGCVGDPTGGFCNWDAVGVSFAGTARSVDFGGAVNQVAFDDVTFGSATPGGGNSVPEIDALAGTGALTLLGFGLALAGERRRRAA